MLPESIVMYDLKLIEASKPICSLKGYTVEVQTLKVFSKCLHITHK